MKARRSDYIERPLCACGCGQRVKRLHRTWIRGHEPAEQPWKRHPSSRKRPRPLCMCGCGQQVKGARAKYVQYHWSGHDGHAKQLKVDNPMPTGAENPSWKGGFINKFLGYRAVYIRPGVYEYEHRYIVALALGYKDGFLPRKYRVARVYPARPSLRGNIVVAGTEGYLKIIQRRARALAATGDASYRWCTYCKTWDRESAMRQNAKRATTYHRECANWSTHLRSSKLVIATGPLFRVAALKWAKLQDEERENRRRKRQDRSRAIHPAYGKMMRSTIYPVGGGR